MGIGHGQPAGRIVGCMMPGPAVIIVDEGGIPVIPVDDRAPVVTIYEPPVDEEPRGTPITIVTDHGTPLVIEGYDP